MPILNVTKTDLLRYFFLNQPIAGIGDASGLQPSSSAGNLYISLHTASPGTSGNQTTNEVSTVDYPGYVRVAVPRTAAGWEVLENRVRNVAAISFPTCVGGNSPVVSWWGIGTDLSGSGQLAHFGLLGNEGGLTVANGVLPRIPANMLAVYTG